MPRASSRCSRSNTGGARALRVGADGRLYAAQPAARRLVSYGPAGDEKVVAQNIQANDLALTKSGAIYFVDTAHKTVGYIDAARDSGASSTDGGEIMSPTALTLTPDQAMLLVARRHGSLPVVVSDRRRRIARQRRAVPASGDAGRRAVQRRRRPDRRLARLHVGDQRDGHSGVRAAGPLHEHPEQARVHGHADHRASRSAGPDRAWLYVTQGGKIFRRETRRTGVVAWEPVKPPQPGL